MDKKFFTHNAVVFKGKRMNPKFAKIINEAVYQCSKLDGAYKYHVHKNHTEFSIYPESADFGSDPSDLNKILDVYEDAHQHVLKYYPNAFKF